MTGQDLAAKLREYGFTKVKSHMTALSEFEELEIRGRLEAYGLSPALQEAKPAEDQGIGGLKIKRKKKKAAPPEPPAATPGDAVAGGPEEPEGGDEAAAKGGPDTPAIEDAPAAGSAETASASENEPGADPGRDTGTSNEAIEAPSDVLQPQAGPQTDPIHKQPSGDANLAAADKSETAPGAESSDSSAAASSAAGEPVGTSPQAGAPAGEPVTGGSAQASETAGSQETAGEPSSADASESAPGLTSDSTPGPKTRAGTTASEESSAAPAAGATADGTAPTKAPSGKELKADQGAPAESAGDAASAGDGKQKTAAVDKPEQDKPEEKGKPEQKIVRPGDKRRAGKVVGFIDPSKFAQPEKRRTQSRRLRSRDDVVPRVMPTMGRDRNSGQVRGDQVRGSLTAQQLREREQGRFLRRRRQQTDTRGGGRRGGQRRQDFAAESPFAGETVRIEEPITIKKLANTLAIKENAVFRIAMRELGFGITINSGIDSDTAQLLAQEFDVELDIVEDIAAEEALLKDLSDKRGAIGEEHLVLRPPTVAFLGHVDHGKTTLIDTIRKSRIASGESGGITQHIGAYQVETKSGHAITVLDTPGHAAFTQMRARGASAVDIVVLVVAADDGVKPQTEEAFNHAKAAGTPIVVALNKADKPEANLERVRNELSALGLTPEEWGGETAMMPVSALKGDGVDDLLERVFLESEVLELHSHPKGPASGVVLEAEIQQGKGKIAHLLIQDGSLKKGDVILAGEGYGKVRSIHDDRGKNITSAGPSKPVQVTGLNELPSVGDTFHVVESLDKAKEVAGERSRKLRQMAQIESSKGRAVSMDSLFEAVAQADKPAINLIIKADVSGSADVLKSELAKLSNDEVEVKIVHSGVGQILESDVDLAITSGAHILAFHTSAANKVRQKAEREGIQVKVYEVIYELLDDVKRFMEGELAPELREEITGHAEVKRVFPSSKFGNIAGCLVLDGTINRNNRMRLLRDGNVVHTGAIAGLRREADAAKDVREGFECGILLQNYNDIKEGDVIETFKILEIKRTL